MTLWMLGYPLARPRGCKRRSRWRARSITRSACPTPATSALGCTNGEGTARPCGTSRTKRLRSIRSMASGCFSRPGPSSAAGFSLKTDVRRKGLAQMRDGLARHRNIGAAVLVPAFLALVAEVHREARSAGRRPVRRERGIRGRAAVWTALLGSRALSAPGRAHASSRGETGTWREHRRGGRRRVVLPPGHRSGAEPEGEIAGAARGSELESAVGGTGKVREAHALLSGVYNWFTEGFDTADLIDAKSLLEELESRAGGSRAGRARRSRPAAPGAG